MAEIATAKSVTWGQARAIVDHSKLKEKIAGVIRAWSIKYPNEVVAIYDQVRAMKREDGYRKFAGMPAKHSAHFAEVPATLYALMRRYVHPDWDKRNEYAHEFYSQFQVGRLNHRSMPDFEK